MLIEAHPAREKNAPVIRFRRGDAPECCLAEDSIYLEISVAKLRQLLTCGAVRVTDFRCLDHASKCCVRTLCLYACARRLGESENNAAETQQQRSQPLS